ncbi:MAG: beta-ketoacyl synthase chain length factor [Chitinophagaceae bacterium]|nr:beta-ketoacyl synthase chain length factor [Chitinophagaceae bacterium]
MYIHKTFSISVQQNLLQANIELINEPVNKKLQAIEPAYEKIPPGILRRMGKSIRMGVGAALPLMSETDPVNGIIMGSANAGMEECVKFLNQIVQYEEGQLTPGNFVQSTGNVIAGQLGLITRNKGYNVTHVHAGLAFENAVLDAIMQLNTNPSNSYLLGGVDEISSFHYNIEALAGTYKKEEVSNKVLYEAGSPGYLVGEGAAMFVVSAEANNFIAKLTAIATIHSTDIELVQAQLKMFLQKNLEAGTAIDLFLSGENGDNRTLPFYTACETLLADDTAIVRYKHMTGDFPTASALGLWYACEFLQQQVPQHMFKKKTSKTSYRNILLYNNFKGLQHSFILVSKAW